MHRREQTIYIQFEQRKRRGKSGISRSPPLNPFYLLIIIIIIRDVVNVSVFYIQQGRIQGGGGRTLEKI